MNNSIIYIMGVSGCGKSTIGRMLSDATGIPFYDGDDFHPEENIRKMASGQHLNDEDRQGWLLAINKFSRQQYTDGGCIIACSALKETYRKLLSRGIDKVVWIYLKGDYALIRDRLRARQSHFMPASLLQSQFDTLEIPAYGIHVDIALPPGQIIDHILQGWKSEDV